MHEGYFCSFVELRVVVILPTNLAGPGKYRTRLSWCNKLVITRIIIIIIIIINSTIVIVTISTITIVTIIVINIIIIVTYYNFIISKVT